VSDNAAFSGRNASCVYVRNHTDWMVRSNTAGTDRSAARFP